VASDKLMIDVLLPAMDQEKQRQLKKTRAAYFKKGGEGGGSREVKRPTVPTQVCCLQEDRPERKKTDYALGQKGKGGGVWKGGNGGAGKKRKTSKIPFQGWKTGQAVLVRGQGSRPHAKEGTKNEPPRGPSTEKKNKRCARVQTRLQKDVVTRRTSLLQSRRRAKGREDWVRRSGNENRGEL